MLVAVNKVDVGGHGRALADSIGWASASPCRSPPSTAGAWPRCWRSAVIAPRASEPDDAARHGALAVIGRPNVGKSSLVNAMVGARARARARRARHHAGRRGHRLRVRGAALRAGGHRGHPAQGEGDRGAREARGGDGAAQPGALPGRVLVVDASEGSRRRTRTSRATPTRRAGPSWSSSTSGTWCRPAWSPGGVVDPDPRAAAVPRLRPGVLHRPRAARASAISSTRSTWSRRRRGVASGEELATLRQAVERRPISSRGVPLTLQSAQQVAWAADLRAPRELPDRSTSRTSGTDQLPAPFPQLRRLADPPALPQGGRPGAPAAGPGAPPGLSRYGLITSKTPSRFRLSGSGHWCYNNA